MLFQFFCLIFSLLHLLTYLVMIIFPIFKVEVKWEEQQGEMHIFSYARRILRPLLVIKDLNKIKSFMICLDFRF